MLKRRPEDNEAVGEKMAKILKKQEREDRKRKVQEGEDMIGNVGKIESDRGPKVNGYDVDDEMVADIEVELDPEEVKKGREYEVEFMVGKLEMFEFGMLEEAMRRNGGKAPTTTRWLDGRKVGDNGEEFVRSRLVGRDFKAKGGQGEPAELFAAMPPLEAKKVLFRMAAGCRRWRRRRGLPEVKVMFIDIRKAHLNAKCTEEEWVELPEEFWRWGRYARLRRWLYGMRRAAAEWEDEYARKLEEIGFRRGKAAPTVFYNDKTKVRVVVHGDDFTCTGTRVEMVKLAEKMAEWWEVKLRGIMGSAADEVKEMTILGRRVKWTEEGIEYEADERHRAEILKAELLGAESNGVVSAAVKPKVEDKHMMMVKLDGDGRRKFREEAARLNYLGQDRSDIQYAVKEACAGMAEPSEEGKMRLKRIARYLVKAERVVWKMGELEEGKLVIEVWVDSDWAKGDERKSTSGGIMTVGGVAVKHWSRSQRTRALSVGEAEYAAMVTGAAEGLGMQALMEDLGWETEVVIKTDSSTAKAVASRRGLGKLRHVEVRMLWVQDAVKRGRIKLKKVGGNQNPADHLTKEKSLNDYKGLLELVGGYVVVKDDAR